MVLYTLVMLATYSDAQHPLAGLLPSKDLRLRKRGAPRKPLPSVLLDWWFEGQGDVDIIKSSRAQRLFWATCRKHLVLISPSSLHKDHPGGHACFICTKKKNSEAELQLRAAIAELQLTCVVETRVLGGTTGLVDAYIPEYDLIVQCDGEGHFKEGMYDTPLFEQHRIDAALRDACREQGRRMLRLHIGDIEFGDAAACVQRAVRCARARPHQGFVWYSKRHWWMRRKAEYFPVNPATPVTCLYALPRRRAP